MDLTDTILENERRKDSIVRSAAFVVVLLFAISGFAALGFAVAYFRADHTLLTSCRKSIECKALLDAIHKEQAIQQSQEAQAQTNGANVNKANTIIMQIEAELVAVCAAVDCHGVKFTPQSFTSPTVPPRQAATTTTTRPRPTTTTSSTTTTTQPKKKPCTTVPALNKCIVGGASASSNQ